MAMPEPEAEPPLAAEAVRELMAALTLPRGHMHRAMCGDVKTMLRRGLSEVELIKFISLGQATPSKHTYKFIKLTQASNIF